MDSTRPARAQWRTLQGLIHAGQRTRFGRDHDFQRIRSPADFRRLVPLRTPGELAQLDYALPASSVALDAAYRHAIRTALALTITLRPKTRLLRGSLRTLGPELSRNRLPSLVVPYTQPVDLNEGLPSDTTCLMGTTDQLALVFRSFLKEQPLLSSVVALGGVPPSLRAQRGESVLLLDMHWLATGPVAFTDPRPGNALASLLRLYTDHGMYFEFVPLDIGGNVPRVSIEEAEIGADYELVVSSAGGLWACRTGMRVVLASLDPPLLDRYEQLSNAPAPVLSCRVP